MAVNTWGVSMELPAQSHLGFVKTTDYLGTEGELPDVCEASLDDWISACHGLDDLWLNHKYLDSGSAEEPNVGDARHTCTYFDEPLDGHASDPKHALISNQRSVFPSSSTTSAP